MGTPPTGYPRLSKYILWYLELNRLTTQCGYLNHNSLWLSSSPPNADISITTQCGYFQHHSMWLFLSPLNVVISIATSRGYFYHNSMWQSPSPLNVIISITTIAGKLIFVSNFAIALHRICKKLLSKINFERRKSPGN